MAGTGVKCPRCGADRDLTPLGTFAIAAQWCSKCHQKDRKHVLDPQVIDTYIDSKTGYVVKVLGGGG